MMIVQACGYANQVLARFRLRGFCEVLGAEETDGQVTILAKLSPVMGYSQQITIPIQVRNGSFVEPSVFYHNGAPYVLSQSALNSIAKIGSMSFNEPR